MCAGMLLARQRLSDEAHLPAALADLTVARVHLESRSGGDELFAGSAPLATAPVSMHISAQRLESKFIPIAPGSQTGERPRPAREFLACIGYYNNARGRAQRVFDMRRGRPPCTDGAVVARPPFRCRSLQPRKFYALYRKSTSFRTRALPPEIRLT